jgi:hypothetical protein
VAQGTARFEVKNLDQVVKDLTALKVQKAAGGAQGRGLQAHGSAQRGFAPGRCRLEYICAAHGDRQTPA